MPISIQLLQVIVTYLETRPFNEVATMLATIQAEYAASRKPAEVGTKVTPDADSQGA